MGNKCRCWSSNWAWVFFLDDHFSQIFRAKNHIKSSGCLAISRFSDGPKRKWMFPKIVGFPPKSSIFIGFSIVNHPFWGSPIFGNAQILDLFLVFGWFGWIRGGDPIWGVFHPITPFITIGSGPTLYITKPPFGENHQPLENSCWSTALRR